MLHPGQILSEVKAGAAELGALDALVNLLRRSGARYIIACEGGRLAEAPLLCSNTEKEYAMYERNLNTVQVGRILAAGYHMWLYLPATLTLLKAKLFDMHAGHARGAVFHIGSPAKPVSAAWQPAKAGKEGAHGAAVHEQYAATAHSQLGEYKL